MKFSAPAISIAAMTLALASQAQAAPAAPAAPSDVAAAAPSDVAAAAPAPASDADAPGPGLADIVVTATKRETNLQRTPIAINVLTTTAIKDRHVQSLYDLADGAIPSLRVATFEARQSALTIGIRGIVPLDANQPAREQGVGIYVDGVYLGRQHGLNAALFDVERIEVLKGPQGTLFGRNTEGGALSIVTKAPTGEFGGRLVGGIGNYGSYNSELHLDLPQYKNFSLKIDGVIQHQDATTKDPLQGQTGWNYYNRKAVRGTLRWKPTADITDDFSADYGRDANTPFYSQLLNYNPNGCVATTAAQPSGATLIPGACVLPGTNFTNGLTGTVKPTLPGVVVEGQDRMKVADIGVPQQVSVDKAHGFTNTFRWHLGPELELRSITAWRGVNATQWDNSGGAHRVPVVAPGCNNGANPNANPPATACNFSRYSLANLVQDQFSQEIQAVGTLGKIDYVAGLYYFNERVEDDASTPNSNAIVGYTTAGQTAGYQYIITDPCTGSGGFGSQPGCRMIDRASKVRSRSYAAYGQVTWNPTDALHITAGGRFTHDKKEGVLLISRNLAYGPVGSRLAALSKPGYATATQAQLDQIGYQPLDKSWNRFNPVATVAYDVTDRVHVYAKFAEGYRSGGASSRTSNYQPFGPEDVKSYEAGLKTDLFDRRVRLNLAGYIMDRKDSQVDLSTLQPTATGTFNNLVTINAPGTTHIRGIEADLTVQPIDGLTLNASYAYTYTRVPLVPVTYVPRNAAGVQIGAASVVDQRFYIVFTPRNAASGSIDYDLPFGVADAHLHFHLDANYSQATQTFDQFATKNDAATIFNGRISIADISMGGGGQKVTVGIYARNLFNEQHVYRRDPSNSLPSVQTGNVTVGSIANILGDYGNFNTPRTFGGEVTVNF